jgi:hypothetical protein
LARQIQTSDEELKSKFGHKLTKLAEAVVIACPGANASALKYVVGLFPNLIERRYELKSYSRIELGHMMMGAQYIAGEILRQFSDRDLRSSMSGNSDWDFSVRTYPKHPSLSDE